MSENSYCQRHPGTSTNLRCGKCEATICPQCMVYAPVGARCPDCAQTAPLPMFDVGNLELAKAVAVSLSIGIGGGVLIGFLAPILFGMLEVVALAGLGYVLGELVSKSVNRKRGRVLQYVAISGMAAAFLTSLVVALATTGLFTIWAIIGAAAGGYVAATRLRI